MSIIYDALKKVQKANTQGQTNPESKTQEKSKKTSPKTYLVYISFLCGGLLIAGFFFSLLGRTSLKPAPTPLAPLPQINITAASEIKLPEPQEEPSPQLELNGIFFSEDKGYALINNRIVNEGDVIGGATVVKIGAGSVELKFKDSGFTLTY